MGEDELRLVGPLVAVGALPRERADDGLRKWQALRREGRDVSLLAVLVKLGLLTRTQAIVLSGSPLERHQPFPDYRVLRRVDEGGMAVVHEATYEPLRARVALKVLKTLFCLQEPCRLRFRREANVLLNLDHPNIVEGREFRTVDGVDFYAMSFVDGVAVATLLERGVLLGEGLALHVAAQVAAALEHMRQKGIVHRDVKPANFVLDQSGHVRIIDFGLAKVMGGMRADTAEDVTVGTLEYLSPEQARGERTVDTRSDVYSLGVSLFHMVTGELPFSGETQAEVMYGHVKRELEFTAAQRARLSPPVQFLIRKMMAKDPEHRYQTPAELGAEMQALAGALIEARGPVPPEVGATAIEAAPIPSSGAPAPAPVPRAGSRPAGDRTRRGPSGRVRRRR